MVLRSDRDDGAPSRPRSAEGPWAKAGTVGTLLGLPVALVATYLAYLALQHPTPPPDVSPAPVEVSATHPAPPLSADPTIPPRASTGADPGGLAIPGNRSTPTPDQPQPPRNDDPPAATGSGPTLEVSPLPVGFRESVTIVGSGFAPADGLQVRLFRSDSISYPVGPDQIVADRSGGFTIAGAVDNPGWCGRGTVAVFTGAASALETPPPLTEAIATAPIGVICS